VNDDRHGLEVVNRGHSPGKLGALPATTGADMASEHADNSGRGEPSTQDTGSALGEDVLATSLGELARTLQRAITPEDSLKRIVDAAVALIPGVADASISTVLGRKRVDSVAPSGALPRRVDAIQTETGQGPCLDAAFEHQTVRVTDMRTERRWPLFAQRAAAEGALSMLSFQLFVDADNLGALNLYAREPDAFTDESEHVGLLFATHAAVAYAAAQERSNLTLALTTRDFIGQAKGILMERFKITGDEAFTLLTLASQRTHRKLRDVAEELAATGELQA
jgi:ANTAR domain/GAF domain